MLIAGFSLDVRTPAGALPMWRATVRAETWRVVAQRLSEAGGRLLRCGRPIARAAPPAVWSSRRPMSLREGLLWLDLPLGERAGRLSGPGATLSLRGTHAAGRGRSARGERRRRRRPAAVAGPRRLARGASLRREGKLRSNSAVEEKWRTDYAFVRVEGDGVHEIPVGPVHAGIIEPGHFRFSVVGEKVLRLEQRLGYKHKGSKSASPNCRRSRRIAWPGGFRVIRRWLTPGPTAWRWNRWPAARFRARRLAARAAART
jgi:hypothetical protein